MKTFATQLLEHLTFLQSHYLDVKELEFGNVVRCHKIGSTQGRGDLAYKTSLNPMDKPEWVGLVTWCRAASGQEHIFKTYGLGQDGGDVLFAIPPHLYEDKDLERNEGAARKSYGFWQNSSLLGTSDYLDRKRVGSYGIRFRSSDQYGNAAVVPMYDESGRLWNRQILNHNGSKLMVTDGRTEGLFHKLQEPINGKPIGISESYVTAATCFELTGILTVCAFSSINLKSTAKSLRKLYPGSPLIFFADNDRHLEIRGIENKGICRAKDALVACEGYGYVAQPEFGDLKPSKDVSDWNDLVRERGIEVAKEQLSKIALLNKSLVG
jgi:hypothetical protein